MADLLLGAEAEPGVAALFHDSLALPLCSTPMDVILGTG